MECAKDHEQIIEALVTLNAKYSELLMRLTVLEHRSPALSARLLDWFKRGPMTAA